MLEKATVVTQCGDLITVQFSFKTYFVVTNTEDTNLKQGNEVTEVNNEVLGGST